MDENTIPENYLLEKTCHLCKNDFQPWQIRAGDHDHYTGRFRNVLHSHCNLGYHPRNFIPVVIHNLYGYDSHLILKNFKSKYADKVQIIPINSEKYLFLDRQL